MLMDVFEFAFFFYYLVGSCFPEFEFLTGITEGVYFDYSCIARMRDAI